LLSIIVPVFNEAPTLEALLGRLDEVALEKEILLVDDGSTDGSADLVRACRERPAYRVFQNDGNRGKGYCVRLGIREARGDVIVFQDADLEYFPAELPALVAPIREGRADVVYGARFLDPAGPVHDFWHLHGNRFLTLLSNLTTGLELNDMETCYKVFRADVIRSIDIVCDDFGSEVEITAKIARLPGIRVWQLPISYAPRTYEQGKKIDWKDGLKAFWYIARFGFFR
jgi:glycosyltransferase involved in cell wall biosynthesis